VSEESTAAPEAQDKGAEGEAKTFTQDEVNELVGKARTEERRKVAARFADYDDLKTKASTADTAEERIAALEREVSTTRTEALRAKYAADVPENLRPLLTATTDDDLKAQRDLILQGVADRKKQGGVAPKEGGSADTKADGSSDEREFVRQLFGKPD
jgi:hypothetical protein